MHPSHSLFPTYRYLYIVRGGNQYDELGRVTFRTTPNIGKQDVKDYLTYMYLSLSLLYSCFVRKPPLFCRYGMVSKKINVITYEGKKKRLPNMKWYVPFLPLKVVKPHTHFTSFMCFTSFTHFTSFTRFTRLQLDIIQPAKQ